MLSKKTLFIYIKNFIDFDSFSNYKKKVKNNEKALDKDELYIY